MSPTKGSYLCSFLNWVVTEEISVFVTIKIVWVEKKKVKYYIFLKQFTICCVSVVKISCDYVDPTFVNYVFSNYKKSRDYFDLNLDKERKE